MEDGPFMVDLPMKIEIFNSYVSLPQGMHVFKCGILSWFLGFGKDVQPKSYVFLATFVASQ